MTQEHHETPTSRTLHGMLADNITALLGAKGMTRTALGDKLTTLGFKNMAHPKVLRRILDGQRRVDVDELAAIALALECTIWALLQPNAIRLVGDDQLPRGTVQIGTASLPAYAYKEAVLGPVGTGITERGRAIDWAASQTDPIVWDMHDWGEDDQWVLEIASRYQHLLPVPLEEIPNLSPSERLKVGIYLSSIQMREEGLKRAQE